MPYFQLKLLQLKIALSMQLKIKCFHNFNCNGFTLHSQCFDTLDWELWMIYSLQKHIKFTYPFSCPRYISNMLFFSRLKTNINVQLSISPMAVFPPKSKAQSKKCKPTHHKTFMLLIFFSFIVCRFSLIFCFRLSTCYNIYIQLKELHNQCN